MNIDPTQQIAGLPALEARKLLRALSSGMSFSKPEIAYRLSGADYDDSEILSKLLDEGLVEKIADGVSDGDRYGTTVLGNAVANASAARPVLRKTAEKALSGFLDRVAEVKSNPKWLCEISEVRLFGSMLTEKPRVSDVDLAFDLTRKSECIDDFDSLCDQRVADALRAGRRFASSLDQIFWPEQEVRLYLKSRSRILSFSPLTEPEKLDAPYKVIYPSR